ncbi:ankyrin repeat domain-containing protein [Wolbachia endosymbiont (group A) of Sphaerophoria taeniata]|uniref:ankyrin repeat domain-containing protein n=1 Tax=Wolbachia endosymbiont (group A) of Sphaerophoria taeniata TaxID=2954057 RepID=UPI002227BD69|nr:ankyrin repeat domain-containing protein [Wolbachia endosymbiont (group A) of Sphaerophoria taeniata]
MPPVNDYTSINTPKRVINFDIDYYEILGVKVNASLDEIKNAYRNLARKHHPDKNSNKETAKKNFQKLEEAYSILKDSKQRAEYDEERISNERLGNELFGAISSKNLEKAKDLIQRVKNFSMFRNQKVILTCFAMNACEHSNWLNFYKDFLLRDSKKVDANISFKDKALSHICKNCSGMIKAKRFSLRDEVIKSLLEYRADVNKVSQSKDKAPIYYALEDNDHNLANLLFQHGAKINVTAELEKAVIANSCKYTKETIRILLKYTSPEQNTEILKHFSNNSILQSEGIEIVKLLLNKGANPFLGEFNAMKIATDKGNSKLIELFNLTQQENDKVSEGSHEKFDVLNIKTLDEVINILNEAVKHNDYEQLDEVINNIDKDDVFMSGLNSDNFKAFCSRYLNLDLQKRDDHKYIYDNMLSKYKLDTESNNCSFLVEELVLLAIAANDKLTEKYQSKLFDQKELESLLLLVGQQKYIDILSGRLKEKDNGIRTVSHAFFPTIALRKEFNQLFTDHVTEYLKTLEDENVVDKIRNILNSALSVKNEECIKTVLSPSLEAKVSGASLLYLAALYSKEVAQALLNGEVYVDIKDVSDMTALHFIARDARQTAQKDTNNGWMEYIWSFFPNSSKDNDDVALFLEGAKFLLSKGADVDVKDNNGITPLYFAVCNGNLEIVKLLVKNGANFNITYRNSTVLNLAKSSKTEKREEVIKFFKEEVEIEKKRTPLHYAVLNDNNETLNLLLKKRCYDVDAKGIDNRTPLDLAIQNSKLEAIKLLLNCDANFNIGYLHLAMPDSVQTKKIACLLISNLKERLKKTEAELAKKKEEMESKIGKVTKLDNTIKELKETNAGLERKNSDLTSQIDDLNKEKNVLDCQFAEKERVLNRNVWKLEDQLKKQTKELDDAKQNLDSRTSEVAKLERTKIELEQNINNLTGKTAQLNNERNILSNTQTRLKQEHAELTKENKQLKDVQVQLEQELESAKQSLNEKISKVTTLTEELEETKTQLAGKVEELNIVNEKVSQLQKKLEGMEVLLRQANKKLMQEQQKASQLNDQVDNRTKELKEAKAQLVDLQNNLGDAKQDLARKTNEVVQLTEKKKQLKGQLNTVLQKLEKAESKNKELSTQNVALGDQNKELEKLKDESENKSQQLEALESQGKQLKGQIESLKAQLGNRNRELSSTNQKVAQLEREQDSIRQDLAAKTRELDEAKVQFEENLNEIRQSLKGPSPDNGNKKLSAASAQDRKQITYASISFVLSGAFAVGASLTMFHLAICITLAVAALTFLAVGCYCSHKANTALSNVEVKNGVDPAVKV